MKVTPALHAVSEQEAFDALLREDFASFVRKVFQELCPDASLIWGEYIEAIIYQLERMTSDGLQRLIVTIPPRYLKSILISVALPTWQLGKNPSSKFMCISYSNELAAKLSRDRRQVIESEWYRRTFPNVDVKRCTDMEIETTAGGKCSAASVLGSITGFGANTIIIDDPIKADDALSDKKRRKVINWISQTLFSRFDDKKELRFILVMQRLHDDDLAGHFLRCGGWVHLNLPAIADELTIIALPNGRRWERQIGSALHPEREPIDLLEQTRKDVGSFVFQAQYQQKPIPAGGTLVMREWLRFGPPPPRLPGDLIIQSWDTASKDGVLSDYSVCVTVLKRANTLYVLDVFRRKLRFPDLLRAVENLAAHWHGDVLLIEDAASGQQLIQAIDAASCPNAPAPIACKPEMEKATRLSACCPFIEVGGLVLPPEAPWLGDFVQELLSFPNGRHDDQVDALSQLLTWDRQRPKVIAAILPDISGSSYWLADPGEADPDEIDVYNDQTGG